MEAAIGLKPLKIGNLVAKHPVIQGGMGVGVSLSSLAGAVAKAEESESFPQPRLDLRIRISEKIRWRRI